MVHLEEEYVALPVVRGVSHGSASLECGHDPGGDDSRSQGVRFYGVEH